MENVALLRNILQEKSKNIFITTHPRPDADALGSSLALKLYLEKLGHKVTVVTPTAYPDFIAWMKSNNEVVVFEGNEKKVESLLQKIDMIFCLDFSVLSRIDKLGELVRKHKATKVLIDHHIGPEDFADFQLWTTQAAATAELIYDFIVQMGDEALLDKDIAECIYAGIMTDTGSFRFPSTTSKVHLIIADLIIKGADNSKIHQLVYDNNSESRLRFLGHCLINKMVVLPEFATAYIPISIEDKEKYSAQLGDTEGVVNYALSIKEIKLAVMIKEEKDMVKLSFRSKGDFSVNEMASQHFSGGGHKNASGGKSDLSFSETISFFESLLPSYKEKLNQF